MSLDPGVEVEGVYWENMDRLLYTNGTIVYKGTDIVEQGTVMYGTLGDQGNIEIININNYTDVIDMNVIRSLNINNYRL